MALSNDQLKAFSFGYLTGYDLLQWCPAQYLIKQYEVDNNSLINACSLAYSEISSSFTTKYNLSAELSKNGNIAPAALAVVTAGVVASVAIQVPGNNFTVAPTVTIMGGGGSGATATAVIVGGVISAIVVTAGGTGYTSAPLVSFSGGQPADTRNLLLVKILSLLSVRNVLGNTQSISEKMTADFTWADATIRAIRNGQMNLPIEIASTEKISTANLVSDSFKTIG